MKVSIKKDHIKIELGIKEKIGAARGSLEIPLRILYLHSLILLVIQVE